MQHIKNKALVQAMFIWIKCDIPFIPQRNNQQERLSIAKSRGHNKKKKKYVSSSPMPMGRKKKSQHTLTIKLYDAV